MARRSRASNWILGGVQAAYLAFAAVYAHRHGLPVPGEGRTYPYLAYLALNVVTFPLAALPTPILFTLVVSRQPITARTGRMLRQVWTSSLAFLALSPLEAGFSGLLTLAVPMIVLPVHAPVAVVCAGVILIAGLYIHEGALAGSPSLPLVHGPAHHQMHHRRGRENANYALLFTLFDRLLGTHAAPAGGGDRIEAVPSLTARTGRGTRC